MIYTTGYTDKNVKDLPQLLEHFDAVLVDIRFSTNSRQLVWTKDYLSLLLKRRYQHIPQLGNRAFKEGKIQIQNIELGIRLLTAIDYNVILLCACKNLRECHRFVVMNELIKRGLEVEELENWQINSPSLF
jgi:uncharacterized protein (DUF488 family)